MLQSELREKGYSVAFVGAFKKVIRISLEEALTFLNGNREHIPRGLPRG